ncbi:MAG: hypothetical protein WBB29_14320 [Geitlerinemataceae cyanobacterium]
MTVLGASLPANRAIRHRATGYWDLEIDCYSQIGDTQGLSPMQVELGQV